MNFTNKIEEHQAIKLLEESGKEFLSLFHESHLSVEIYKPQLIDKQTPHDRDEFYLIISGRGKFQLLEKVTAFRTGDFLYVPAHAEHKFFEFTDDFITWVFFIS